MLAYANPEDRTDQTKRADGYGLVRFNKKDRTATFECWPRFSDVANGNSEQFPGWPITIDMNDNDGRTPTGWLPEIVAAEGTQPVVQVIDEATNDVLYTVRAPTNRFRPRVYTDSTFTIKIGLNRPDKQSLTGLKPSPKQSNSSIDIDI